MAQRQTDRDAARYHYRQAVELLRDGKVAEAQVHATLFAALSALGAYTQADYTAPTEEGRS
jgi:hypothetical protein